MKTAVIYGAAGTGKSIYAKIKDKYNILFFTDRNPALIGETIDGISIKNEDEVIKTMPDILIMGVLTGYDVDAKKFVSKGFPEERIITSYVDLPHRARTNALELAAEIIKEKNVPGAVAELGVYMGDFSKEINRVFSDRTLYLFDTFEGFPKEDLKYEAENNLLLTSTSKWSNTSLEIVKSKLPYPEKCRFIKGYFPESTLTLSGGGYAFVNIDADLYKPILAGLEYFWPRLSPNGYIFVHDYFSETYAGAKKAIEEFASKNKIPFIPIGDTMSVAFCKMG